MNILIVLAMPYPPQATGGIQSSCHEMALDLLERGHSVSVLAGLAPEGYVGIKSRICLKLSSSRHVGDASCGYSVFRKWFVWDDVDEILSRANPDVVLIQQGPGNTVLTAREFLNAGAKAAVYLRDVEVHQLGGDLRDIQEARFFANSAFTAARYRKLFGVQAKVILPTVRRERYETIVNPKYVTYVNPHPLKGSELALEVAERCPEIPFTFVESWGMRDDAFRAKLKQRLKSLPNVTLRPETHDMREVFAQSRFVLMPSKWEEAWGRVATEAHFSGIPVIASKVGGLAEAVGPGGVLIDPSESTSAWVAAVEKLWNDEESYRNKSAAALEYSRRPELDRNRQLDALVSALRESAA